VASVTLPSGRVVELHEPTFGEEMHIVASSRGDLEEMMYAKCLVICPSLTRDEIAAMPREEGRALIVAVGQVWDGRPEEQEAPFGNGSVSPSMSSAVPISPTTQKLEAD